MLDCSRFLEGYSAYRDGELQESERAAFAAHCASCASCAKYDRVIREGVRLYRSCPEIAPSDDFLPKLQHRLYHIEEEMRGPGRTGSGARAAVTLAVAASIAGLAWVPALRTSPDLYQLPGVVAQAPVPEPLEFAPAAVFAPTRDAALEGGSVFPLWEPMQTMQPADDFPFVSPSFGSEPRLRSVSQW
jgi:hypothetical protein